MAKTASIDRNKPQIDRFKEAARELGCDESEAVFDSKMKAIVKPKTSPDNANGLQRSDS